MVEVNENLRKIAYNTSKDLARHSKIIGFGPGHWKAFSNAIFLRYSIPQVK